LPNMNCTSGYYGHEEVSLSHSPHMAFFLCYFCLLVSYF
jgi:hypothetical protein